MKDVLFHPAPDDGQWFRIQVSHPDGPVDEWPRGQNYLTQATRDAAAFQAYLVIASKSYYAGVRGADISVFSWEHGDAEGDYLRDQNGWYLSHDGASGCLCLRPKAQAAGWRLLRHDGDWYLRAAAAERSYVSWLPDQDWDGAVTTLFVSVQEGLDNALLITLEQVQSPKLA